ncbi:unnamed protein product [Rhizophagus irregularis]|nr:unnamed protein product [Rhizophagus irregularis]
MSSSSKNSLKRFFPPAESSNKRGKTSIPQENQEELSSSESETEQAPTTKGKRSHERKVPDQNWFKFYPCKEYLVSSKTSILKQPDFKENDTRAQYASYSNCNAGNEFLERH